MGAHAQTNKEACFEKAVDTLKDHRERMGKPTPEIDHQRPWTQNRDTGEWRPEPTETTWGKIMGSIKKTIRILTNQQGPEPGRWPTGQPRFPDATATGTNGKSVPVDLKFDRPSGGTDTWGKDPGSINGKTQQEDYNEMVKQQTGREDQNLSLDPKSCDCPEDPAPVEEVDPALAPSGQFYLAPQEGALPEMPSMPELAPEPLPVF